MNNKNNGTVAGFQAVKCRYIVGSKKRARYGTVWTQARNWPATGPFGPVNFYLCIVVSCGLSDLRDIGNYGSLPRKTHIYAYLISTEPFFLAKELRKSRKHWNHVTCILLFVLKATILRRRHSRGDKCSERKQCMTYAMICQNANFKTSLAHMTNLPHYLYVMVW